jgi:uncharacterized protein YbbK (DUF523 family)
MILISACLVGLNTRYDGANCGEERFKKLFSERKAFPICPEHMGGLLSPREPVELIGGDGDAVLRGEAKAIGKESGKDYTDDFISGAEETLNLIRTHKIESVILKDGSPSCGSTYIKRGGERVKGMGITAALLIRAGITVETEGR